MELGKRYRLALEWSGLDQDELGAKLGISDWHVRSLMAGAVQNMGAHAREWATATSVRYEWLLTGEGSAFPLSDDDRLGRIEELLEAMLVQVRALRADREADATQSAGEST